MSNKDSTFSMYTLKQAFQKITGRRRLIAEKQTDNFAITYYIELDQYTVLTTAFELFIIEYVYMYILREKKNKRTTLFFTLTLFYCYLFIFFFLYIFNISYATNIMYNFYYYFIQCNFHYFLKYFIILLLVNVL